MGTYFNQFGPYYIVPGIQGGPVANPDNAFAQQNDPFAPAWALPEFIYLEPGEASNVAETDPAPPAFNVDYGVNSTGAFWWRMQGLLNPLAPQFTSYNTASFTVGQLNVFNVQAIGNPIPSLTASVLPPGITFVDKGNGIGVLSGTPTEDGAFTITFEAVNGDQYGASTSQFFTLTLLQV